MGLHRDAGRTICASYGREVGADVVWYSSHSDYDQGGQKGPFWDLSVIISHA